MTGFREYLHTLIADYGGTKSDFARAVRIKPYALSKLLTTTTPPSPGLCLRIAAATRTSPARLLRLADHDDLVDVLDTLYGPRREPPADGVVLSGIERRNLLAFRRVPKRWQRLLTELHEALAAAHAVGDRR